ncbi:hypothetical protein Pint_34839 [Pistacia integerrima]|uniref:Uncharacterized protein n=1 Tax=Pistacia integerrima TaxID=434235 RepID=A0ACC0X6J9_9ROSI|nr:hypothetical protein Pint_34839 [Pistacia integerrima]
MRNTEVCCVRGKHVVIDRWVFANCILHLLVLLSGGNSFHATIKSNQISFLLITNSHHAKFHYYSLIKNYILDESNYVERQKHNVLISLVGHAILYM